MLRYIVKMKKRKAQMEIMGLVMIIILILVGMLFFIRFGVLKQQKNVRKTFIQTELASNILTSMVKTSTYECKDGTDIGILLKDAATTQSIDCFGESSIEFANSTIREMLNRTLGTWGFNYNFNVIRITDTGREYLLNITRVGCINASSVQAAYQPIPLNPGTLIIAIKVC